jgi:hypothetical protein
MSLINDDIDALFKSWGQGHIAWLCLVDSGNLPSLESGFRGLQLHVYVGAWRRATLVQLDCL